MNAVQMSQLTSMSKSRIAKEFGVDRRTVDNLIKDIPAGDKSGPHQKWYIKEIAGVMDRYVNGGIAPMEMGGEDFDPKKLIPADRKNWYESETKRLAVEKEQGKLIPDDVFENVLAEVFKSLKTTLTTLPDVLERDVNLSPEQVVKAETVIDGALLMAHRALVGEE